MYDNREPIDNKHLPHKTKLGQTFHQLKNEGFMPVIAGFVSLFVYFLGLSGVLYLQELFGFNPNSLINPQTNIVIGLITIFWTVGGALSIFAYSITSVIKAFKEDKINRNKIKMIKFMLLISLFSCFIAYVYLKDENIFEAVTRNIRVLSLPV